jgi:hypothetical protein
MDPFLWRTISYVVLSAGTVFVLFGTIGTWYFSNLAEQAAPYRQSVRNAAAQVDVVMQTEKPVNSFYKADVAYLIFRRGSDALLTTADYGNSEIPQSNDRTMLRGVFHMDANDPAVGRPVSDLQKAEFVEIRFVQMPTNARIVGGHAIVTVNSAVRLEMNIPEQYPKDGLIFVREIAPACRDFR